MTIQQQIKLEQDLLRFFLDHTNWTEGSPGYGLTIDHSENPTKMTIAATGFLLSGLAIADERGLLTRGDVLHKVLGILKTLNTVETFHGFFPHFLDNHTGQRRGHCEYSTIDSVILFAGLLTIDSYLQNKDVSNQVQHLLNQVNWEEFVSTTTGKTQLRMSYNPDKGGDYVEGKPGYISRWSMFAEQLLMYPMIAGLIPDEDLARKLYQGFDRTAVPYRDGILIYPPHNTLFIYHLPLLWLDASKADQDGINWVQNAVLGTMSHIDSSRAHAQSYRSFQEGYFGMNASDSRNGYRVFGALPNIEDKLDTDGTIAPVSIIGSLPYVPREAEQALSMMFAMPGLYGPYGFYDAFQIEEKTPWICSKYYALNKGMELLTLDLLSHRTVQQAFMNHPIIRQGCRRIGIPLSNNEVI